MRYEIIIDEEKCNKCLKCFEVCPVDVYIKKKKKSIPVNSDRCLNCESCLEVCEADAIKILESCCS